MPAVGAETETSRQGVLTLADAEQGLSAVEDVIRDCLRQSLKGKQPGLSLKTRMTLRILHNGQLAENLFAPPLAPGVMGCVSSGLGQVSFAPSAQDSLLSRDIEIELPKASR
jgi:hypothetical protein